MTKSKEIKMENALQLAIIQKTPIKINGLVVDLKIENNKIKIESNEEVELEEVNEINFEYEGVIHKALINLSEEGFIEIETLKESYKNEDRIIDINEYGILTNNNTKFRINIKKITKNKIFFNVLKKDENLIFSTLDSNSLIELKINNEDIKINIIPVIENISDNDDILVFSETNIDDKKEVFKEYLQEQTKKQDRKEKKILIDNLIKEIY